ncbi:MAG: hypothetical protein MUO76_15050 [Anaerolineaceae bacterium]|nr:hypothetical protein [Anaerolineaceae bacterium]
MSRYSSEEPEDLWEFKIVRSSSGAFRKPEIFQRLLEEEALSGWELLEKLDNSRVRFKRLKSIRQRDAMLPPGVDPYRSQYGSADTRKAVVIIALIVVILPTLLFFSKGNQPGSQGVEGSPIIWMIIAIAGVMAVLGGIIVVIVARR